jgi:hypothetical protein
MRSNIDQRTGFDAREKIIYRTFKILMIFVLDRKKTSIAKGKHQMANRKWGEIHSLKKA